MSTERTLFGDRLASAITARHNQVFLGVDPDPRIAGEGPDAMREFCERLLRAAGPACVAVKPQLAWFERLGAAGWGVLEYLSELAGELGLLVIADGKRGDIGVSAAAYAQGLLRSPFDAMTANPWLGTDSVQPFLDRARATGRGIFLMVRTSNPSAAELQDLELADGHPWHEAVARLVSGWGADGVGKAGVSDVGAVVGATVPQHLGRLRELMPDQPFLMPGVGAQGGRPEDLGEAFAGRRELGVVAASRSIMKAEDPQRAAEELREALWKVSGP